MLLFVSSAGPRWMSRPPKFAYSARPTAPIKIPISTVHSSLDMGLRFGGGGFVGGGEGCRLGRSAGIVVARLVVESAVVGASLTTDSSESLYASTLLLLAAFFRNIEDMRTFKDSSS